MGQMETAPQLAASGLKGDYRLLADFNDTSATSLIRTIPGWANATASTAERAACTTANS